MVFYLKIHEEPLDGFKHYLISPARYVAYPVNESAALIWECCYGTWLISDLITLISQNFPDIGSTKQDIVEILGQFEQVGLVKFSGDPCNKRDFPMEYRAVIGIWSERAERLVSYCLGEFKDKPIPPCNRNLDYLLDGRILLLENECGSLVESSHFRKSGDDQKKVAEALISQRALVPPNFKCWLVRGNHAGAKSDPAQGIHVAGMRRNKASHVVLVPSACRDRYLGPNLEKQIKELRQSWVPWEEKSDTAWWGGALTGDVWKTDKTRTVTRREVLIHYRDNPTDRVHLSLTELSSSKQSPPGIELKAPFTKRSAYMHKCLVLLPGNDIASGSSWFFAGNSVVLMPKPHMDHILYFELNEWEHYIPLENDPADILVKLDWVLNNEDKARQIVDNAHQRLLWLCGPEYLWACNEVLRRIAASDGKN